MTETITETCQACQGKGYTCGEPCSDCLCSGELPVPAAKRVPPPPAFDFKAYGVSLAIVGEEGAMMADGHVPLVRFAAACNRVARTELLCRNLLDYSEATLAEALEGMRHCWVLPAVDPDGDGCDWYVRWGGVTAETPGALPVTLWEP